MPDRNALRTFLRNRLRDALIIVPTVWVLMFAILWTFQERLLFPAPTVEVADLDAWAAQTGATVAGFTDPHGFYRYGWTYDPPGGRDGRCLVVYFHGNGETVVGVSSVAVLAVPAGCSVAVWAWRGYPGSPGSTTEASLREDAAAVLDHVTTPVAQGGLGFDLSRVVLLGKSLGTGLAVDQASQKAVGALVLEAPYTSLADAAGSHYPWLPVRTFIRHPLDSIGRTSTVRAPTLVVHGTGDVVVPFVQGAAMAAALRARLVEVPDGVHHRFESGRDDTARAAFLEIIAAVRDAP